MTKLETSIFTTLPIPYTAVTLAHAFVDSSGDEREPVVALVRRAGQQLIDSGAPGAWARFEPRAFFAGLGISTAKQRRRMALRLVRFFHWLWVVDLIDTAAADRVSKAVLDEISTSLLEALYESQRLQRQSFMGALERLAPRRRSPQRKQ